MQLRPGSTVTHADFGPGTVKEIVGDLALVEFFGEDLQVSTSDLVAVDGRLAPVAVGNHKRDSHFRQAYEAINLGVVPAHPEQLIALTINGERLRSAAHRWLDSAREEGMCKVVFGDYGAGKSHYLRLVEAAALSAGWVVSYVEFDPKEADPAKPHLVYRNIMASLRFPNRDDGTRSQSFIDMIREMRLRWEQVTTGAQFRQSPWFRATFNMLRQYPHASSREYLDSCAWLAGAPVHLRIVHSLCRERRCREFPPSMPRSRECADIYVHNLVVVDEICRALGYRGFLLILDEAEHVRGFNVRRKERANNLFDLLARSSHLPLGGEPDPLPNEHGHSVPQFWKNGPHFSLVVGLTEGATFSDPSLALREACVFLHSESDAVRLVRPSRKQYEAWCRDLFEKFHSYNSADTPLLASDADREALAHILATEFGSSNESENSLRIWTKLAALVPAITIANPALSIQDLQNQVRLSARQACGRQLPWETATNA